MVAAEGLTIRIITHIIISTKGFFLFHSWKLTLTMDSYQHKHTVCIQNNYHTGESGGKHHEDKEENLIKPGRASVKWLSFKINPQCLRYKTKLPD